MVEEPFISLIISIDKKMMYEIIDCVSKKEAIKSKKNSIGVFSDEITKKIEDLTLSNLFKLNIFVSENKEDCEWHVKNFKISDNLDLQIFDLEEAFEFIKNHLNKNQEINQNSMEM